MSTPWTSATKPLWKLVLNTAVDKAEDEPELATLINAFAPKVLADACLKHDAVLIHISTDYVFGGDANEPYRVDDPINPKSVYGSTKAEGERLIRESGCSYMIVRTAWLYSSVGKNNQRGGRPKRLSYLGS